MRGRKTEEQRRAAARVRQQHYVEANREKVRASKRAYIERHPERRKATLQASWERLRADPERYAHFLAQCRASNARHPETGYLYALNWRAENRERLRANNRAAGSRRRERVGDSRAEVAEYARVLLGDPCSYCGGPADVIDHIVALASGGEHEARNLTAACRRCNARKRTIPLLPFLAKAT